jgi:SNF2 family DNA or RNA helicase
MKLRPYQDNAADFLFEHDRALILAPVGAGKTALTLTAMFEMLVQGHAQRFLVLAPKRVCTDVWPVEAEKWTPQMPVAVAVGTAATRSKALHSYARVVVTNYDNLQWLCEQPLSFDAVVFDELTKLKNPSGKRFKALDKVIASMRIRWGLTGSFTSNGLEDTFGQCKIVDQGLLGRSKGAFLQQYFICLNRDFGQWTPAPGALEQVMARIKPATFVLDAGDYTDTLPPLHTIEMRCDLPDREPYEKMKRDLMVEFPDAQAVAANAAVLTSKLQQMAGGWVYDTTSRPHPHHPGEYIIERKPVWFSDHKFDLLDEIIEENQHANTLIVYNYQEELHELMRRYPKAETLDHIGAIERWNKGEIEMLLIHPKSAGHGLNLQHGGNRIIWVSLPWSLELFEQTVGRLHRSGQRHDVWCYLLISRNTVDERVWAALHDKRSMSDIALEELKDADKCATEELAG